jgi:tetrahydromethanopterin S-methyltransferase subunit E
LNNALLVGGDTGEVGTVENRVLQDLRFEQSFFVPDLLTTSNVPTAAGIAESWLCADMSQPLSSLLMGISIFDALGGWGRTLQAVKTRS